ncbi:antibiotic biosynthesis monooxygenase [Stigmatella aurantiaca]|nr:antibiotic biosynthesis monooxygenase [Stigmatella aurantiaca]ADO71844.1 Antibiotic biosynthesis monooxygenase domain protein [Stigmatella aurantiaca DW4/3-1]
MEVLKIDGSATEPVKIVLERRIKPGAQPAFEQWLKALMKTAAQHPALQGSSVFKAGEGDYFILLRFESQSALSHWQSLPEVVELLRAGEAHATPLEQPVVRTGLETWFTVPGMPAKAVPPKWKMALVTWLALLPQALILGSLLPKTLPRLVAVSVSTAIPVAALTWFIMPRLTGLLSRWLYAPTNR